MSKVVWEASGIECGVSGVDLGVSEGAIVASYPEAMVLGVEHVFDNVGFEEDFIKLGLQGFEDLAGRDIVEEELAFAIGYPDFIVGCACHLVAPEVFVGSMGDGGFLEGVWVYAFEAVGFFF